MKAVGIFFVFRLLIGWLLFFGIIYLAITGTIAACINPSSPPKVEDAQWAIQTYSTDGMSVPSRVYYAEDVETINGVPTIINYWSFDGKHYKFFKGEKEFPEELYGNITITRRGE